MTIEELRGYKQIRTPDVASLANYINRAKGTERTMAQFAADTEISPSTLSRIVNMNIKKPLSAEMIIAIFNNRADQTDERLLGLLVRANGLESPERVERMTSRASMWSRRLNELNIITMMKNAILGGILAAGTPIAQVFSGGRMVNTQVADPKIPSMFNCRKCDFSISLGKNQSNINEWKVYAFPSMLDDEDIHMQNSVRWAIQSVMRGIAPLLLCDAWEPDSLKGTKTSFAFVDERVFASFVEEMRCAKLNNEMTILLLDPKNGYKVVDEVWIPGTYDQLSNVSVFAFPAPEIEDEFYEYDEYDDFREGKEDNE